jgi:short-subunit dehydrogenase involved in D-alanine esterification of teichoic acids
MKVTGNTILITGAANGIGLEIAKLFNQQDNKVIMADKATALLEAEAARLANAIAITVDLADEDDVNKFIETLMAEHQDLNIAVLNAAVAHYYTLFSPDYIIWGLRNLKSIPTILQM